MHSLEKTRVLAALCAVALSTVTWQQARATVIMYEPFSGYTNGSIYGQTPNATGLSTGTNWTKSGSGDSAFDVVGTGLTFGSGSTTLNTTGGALVRSAPSPGNGGNTVVHAVFDVATYTGTLYTASLIDFGDNSLAAVNIAAGQTTSTTSRRFYTSIRGAPSGDWTGIPGVDWVGSSPVTAANAYSAANTTYIVLGRFTNVGSTATSQNPGVADMFILTTAQFDNFKAGGLTDAELDAAVIGAASNQVLVRVTDTQTSGSGTFPLVGATTMSLQIFGNPNGDTDGVTYDELRWGDSLDAVTPVVPEPSTLALAGLGVCCLGFARMRRRIRK